MLRKLEAFYHRNTLLGTFAKVSALLLLYELLFQGKLWRRI